MTVGECGWVEEAGWEGAGSAVSSLHQQNSSIVGLFQWEKEKKSLSSEEISSYFPVPTTYSNRCFGATASTGAGKFMIGFGFWIGFNIGLSHPGECMRLQPETSLWLSLLSCHTSIYGTKNTNFIVKIAEKNKSEAFWPLEMHHMSVYVFYHIS